MPIARRPIRPAVDAGRDAMSPTAGSDRTESSSEGRRIDPALIEAVVLALRRRGLVVTPEDHAICIALFLERPRWSESEIIGVCRSVLAKRPADELAIAELWRELLAIAPPREPPTSPPRPPPPPPPPKFIERLVSTARSLVPGRSSPVWRFYGPLLLLQAFVLHHWKPLRRMGDELIDHGLATARELPNLVPSGVATEPNRVSELLVVPVGVGLATTLTGVGVWLLRRLRKRSPSAEVDASDHTAPAPRKRNIDETVFRVGYIGGDPPGFLGEPYRSDIAALFGYRAAGPDLEMIDVAATIDAQINEADPSTLCYRARRELPTILTLIDGEAEGATWNSLQPDFEALLRQRGIPETQVVFPGSFYRGLTRSASPRPEAQAVMEALDAPGWTVTVLFGEAHRMSPRDRDLMRSIRENGPLLFLELRDPALWDGRHHRLIATGVSLRPATAEGLRDGLSRIFAPHLSSGRAEFGRSAASDGRTIRPYGTVFQMLDEAHLNWASDCSLIEPISFALAETLRNRYDGLRTPLPNLAFSRLAALPGSWLGPEGLRFEPSVRRALQNRFTLRPREDRERTVDQIEKAFGAATQGGLGGGAQAMHDYALNSVRLIGLTSDEAWREIDELGRSGTMAGGLVEELFARLRPKGARAATGSEDANLIGGGETILLADEPETAGMRDWLDDVRSRQANANGEPSTQPAKRRLARWTLSVPDTLLAFKPDDPTEASSGSAAPVGGFVAGGRHLLVASPCRVDGKRLHLFDLLAATSIALPGIPDGLNPVAVMTARDAQVAAVIDASGRVYMIAGDPMSGGMASASAQERGIRVGKVAALSLDGRTLWWGDDRRLRSMPFAAPSEERPAEIEMPASISAIHMADETSILVGLDDGGVFRYDIGEHAIQQIDRVDEAIVALAGGASPNGTSEDGNERDPIVAASADGRLTLAAAGRPPIVHRLRGTPIRLALLRDRPGVFSPEADSSSRSPYFGCSVMVHFERGGFDILSLPEPSEQHRFAPFSALDGRVLPGDISRRAIAFGSQTRRIAIHERGRLLIRSLLYRQPVGPDPQESAMVGSPDTRIAAPSQPEATVESAVSG